jgi:hypothetical protein
MNALEGLFEQTRLFRKPGRQGETRRSETPTE